MTQTRGDGRNDSELRRVEILPSVNPYAEGSAEVSFGQTKVLVTASVLKEVPRWMEPGKTGGWITAEYGMLPRSTHTRNRREASTGKQGGRTLEIQRLIGRALRAAVDLSKLGEITVQLDCDVICADGGTRTAAISGAWVALHQALKWAENENLTPEGLNIRHVAAVSVGMSEGRSLLDLCYEEDSQADFDLNLVFNEIGELVEVQGTGEKQAVRPEKLFGLIELGWQGVEQIFDAQRRALGIER